MNRPHLPFCLSILLAALPVQADIYKCVVNGRTEFRDMAAASEGCEAHEVKAVPYDPREAARAKERLKQMEANDQAYQAGLARSQQERAKRAEQQQEQRAADDRAQARAAAERQAREAERLKAAVGYGGPSQGESTLSEP